MPNKLWFQKDYSRWRRRPARRNTIGGITPKGNDLFPPEGTDLFPPEGHTKEKKETLQKKEKPSSIPTTDEAKELTELLLTKIIENHSTGKAARNPDEARRRWPVHVDWLMRLDGRTPKEIAETILWCQQDDFWMANILSTKKLREKWDTLRARMKRKGGGHGKDNYDENRRIIERYARKKGVSFGGDVHEGDDDPHDALPEPSAERRASSDMA